MDFGENWLLILAIYGGVILAAFWLALVIWAYRDMRARSRDGLARLFVTVMVAVLNIPGIFIYILLRPRETLSEAYERSLEEEALLQEIEEKPVCPGCGGRIQPNWQACPSCHTRLKKPCPTCRSLLELSWNLCPHCASPQPQYLPEDQVINSSRHISRMPVTPAAAPEPPNIPDKWMNPTRSEKAAPGSRAADAPRYVDENY